ncbi:phosphatidate cytidylyltransferase [Paenibacillus sp. SC116]|uniref:phosphatidate cytidylyltransferase n=1 Tax=Paenibacillus sp. SC116 TaxID=2968986 RepID=UPI00215B4956|nr:phosphatidate cytidylyltransferase [Paenibacillus sp. SC116]MCR8845484.1 phosphatidate cytidylyltransferase [Paenibacillus sp. SC116]
MKQRIMTGVIAGSFFAVLVYIGSFPYEGLLIALALIGFYEYARMLHKQPFDLISLLGYGLVLLLSVPWSRWGIEINWSPDVILWLFMFIALSITVISKNRITIQNAAVLWFGALYVGFGFKYMIVIRNEIEHGLFWTILLFAAVWASDIGAYFVGRAIGKHKLWPAISPNKTIEGAVGGVLVSIIVCLIGAFTNPDMMSITQAVILALTVSLAGQMGDLIQSAYKRVQGVKDSGNLLPGHGGVLDRCDSWLIVFPLAYFIGVVY